MADETLEGHGLYATFIQLEPKFYLNCSILRNIDRSALSVVTSLLARIYFASKTLPVTGAMFGKRLGNAGYSVSSLGYTVFADDNVLVTVGVELL